MLGKFYHLLAIVSIGTLLSAGGFLYYLYHVGKLSADKVDSIAAVMRGELSVGEQKAEVEEEAEPDANDAGITRAASAEEIRQRRLEQQLDRALLDRAAQEVRQMQELLDQSLAADVRAQERFADRREAWLRQKSQLEQEVADEGFKTELAYIEKLNPRQAKQHVLKSWEAHPADVVRIFKALKPSKGQRILNEFKSPEEIEIMHELLEQLRYHDIDRLVAPSGMTPEDDTDRST